MYDYLEFPDDSISKKDKSKLEEFASVEMSLGVAQYWRWEKGIDGADIFRLYARRNNPPLLEIRRSRQRNVFIAQLSRDPNKVAGKLDDVLTFVGSRNYATERSDPVLGETADS